MASLATGHGGRIPTLRLAAGLSGHEVQPAPSGEGRRRRSGRAAVPWGGGSGEAQLGLGSGGREGWGLGAEAQMMEDPARDERVGEGGDAVAAAAARGAAQHVHRGLWLPLHMAGSISVLALIVIHAIVVTRCH